MHARTLGWPTCTHTNVHTHTSHLITRRHERMHRFMHETCVTHTVGSMGCTNSHEHTHKWMHKLISLSTRVLKVELREWGFFFFCLNRPAVTFHPPLTNFTFLSSVCVFMCVWWKKDKEFLLLSLFIFCFYEWLSVLCSARNKRLLRLGSLLFLCLRAGGSCGRRLCVFGLYINPFWFSWRLHICGQKVRSH